MVDFIQIPPENHIIAVFSFRLGIETRKFQMLAQIFDGVFNQWLQFTYYF